MTNKTYEQALKQLGHIVEATRREATSMGLNFREVDIKNAAREIGNDGDVERAILERETKLAQKSMRDAF